MTTRRFNTGRLLLSRAASKELTHEQYLAMFRRHVSGDWGVLSLEDKEANERALRSGDRLLSAYEFGGKKWWVITEADRSATTLLAPEEY